MRPYTVSVTYQHNGVCCGTHAGHQAAKGAGGIVLARVELDVAGLGLGFLARDLEVLGGLGAQLVGLVLCVVDDRVGRVQVDARLEGCRRARIGRGLRAAAQCVLQGVVVGEERRHGQLLDGRMVSAETRHVRSPGQAGLESIGGIGRVRVQRRTYW